MKRLIISIILLASITTALWFLKNHDSRLPSSLPHSKDSVESTIAITDKPLTGDTKKQIKKVILSSWDWYFRDQTLFISFENMKLISADKANDLCELYPTISLSLEAPNVTYNGEHPEIIVTLPCTSPELNSKQAPASNRLVNLDLDMSFLLNAEALTKINQNSNDAKSSLRFQNWDSEVPLRWRVKQMLFFPATEDLGGPIDLVKYEILGVLTYSVEFALAQKKQ